MRIGEASNDDGGSATVAEFVAWTTVISVALLDVLDIQNMFGSTYS